MSIYKLAYFFWKNITYLLNNTIKLTFIMNMTNNFAIFYNNLVLPNSELLTSKELEKVKQNMEHLLAVTC